MTTRSVTWPFPARMKTEYQIDSVLLAIVSALLLGGLVILASASISISDNAANNTFFYVRRSNYCKTNKKIRRSRVVNMPWNRKEDV